MSGGGDGPGTEIGRARRVVLAPELPDAEGTPDHTVHLVGVPLGEPGGGVSGLCGARLRPGRIETVAPGEGVWCTSCFVAHVTGAAPVPDAAGEGGPAARVAAVVAYRELGWPVTVRAEQVSLNLDLDLDAVALVIPAELTTRVTEILTRRRSPPGSAGPPGAGGAAGDRGGGTLRRRAVLADRSAPGDRHPAPAAHPDRARPGALGPPAPAAQLAMVPRNRRVHGADHRAAGTTTGQSERFLTGDARAVFRGCDGKKYFPV
ncbi:MAG: hypothetical protein ACRDRV_22035 [Pseudonocardiaceae bacterium]